MSRQVVVFAVIMSLFAVSVSNADIINDGGTHDISTEIMIEDILVYDGSGPTPTTVNVQSGAMVGTRLEIHDTSVGNMYGGYVSTFFSFDDSVVNIYNGDIDSLRGRNRGEINVYNGFIMDLNVGEQSHANVYDGFVQSVLSVATGQVSIEGGEIGLIESRRESVIDIYGGLFDNILANHSSVVNIYGTGFNYDYGPITDSIGTLTGTLYMGDSFSTNFQRIIDAATINLVEMQIVPAPGAYLLGMLGLSVAGVKLSKHA